jgi:hypothetical protein
MEKPDFEKSAEEINEMQRVPSVSIKISPLQVLGTIALIQAAIQQDLKIADDGLAKIGIAAAQQLQEDLFKQYPETYKVLEFGWNPGAYLVTPETIAAMMLDIESRRSEENRIIEWDGGCDETPSQQISRKIIESQGYLDM